MGLFKGRHVRLIKHVKSSYGWTAARAAEGGRGAPWPHFSGGKASKSPYSEKPSIQTQLVSGDLDLDLGQRDMSTAKDFLLVFLVVQRPLARGPRGRSGLTRLDVPKPNCVKQLKLRPRRPTAPPKELDSNVNLPYY